MIENVWIATAATLFVWWISTGAIIWIAKRLEHSSTATRQLATILAAPLAAAGLWLAFATRGDLGAMSIYGAFLAAILIWGWIEFAFMTGVIAGSHDYPARPDRPEWERFIHAWGAIAYHEMLLTAALVALYLATDGALNKFAFWTFAVLFFARVSAQLNLFLGVLQVNTEFLPRPLSHLASHFRTRPSNILFPASITLLTFAAACWIERAVAYEDAGRIAGFSMLAALTSLALIEHWMLMSKLPDARLWRFLLPDAKPEIGAKMKRDPDGL